VAEWGLFLGRLTQEGDANDVVKVAPFKKSLSGTAKQRN
jgi:hypothetical protein